jgi:ribonuclease P protein component
MLPRTKRLTTKGLNEVMEKGKIVHSPLFLARILPASDKARFAAIAPQKIAKTASERIRIRRLIYKGLTELYPSVSTPIHCALFAKQPILVASSDVVTADIRSLFVKAGLLR